MLYGSCMLGTARTHVIACMCGLCMYVGIRSSVSDCSWVRRSERSNETGLVVAVDRLSRSSILTVEPTEAVRASGAAQTVLPAASSQDPTGQPRSSLDAARLRDDIHILSRCQDVPHLRSMARASRAAIRTYICAFLQGRTVWTERRILLLRRAYARR